MKRPLAVLGFSYFAVLIALNFIPFNFIPSVLIIFSVLVLLSLINKKMRNDRIFPAVFLMCLLAAVVYAGNYNLNIKPIKKFYDTDLRIVGTICDIPQKKKNGYNYLLKVKSVDNNNVRPFKVIVKTSEAIDCDIYDDFTGYVHMYMPENSLTFESGLYYKSKDIYSKAFLYSYRENFIKKSERHNFFYYILKLRQNMISSSKEIFPLEIAKVINGILIGEKHEISKEVKQNFLDAGIYHILATSGLHISILSQFFIWFFKKLKFGKRLRFLCSAMSILFFMALTGFTPSVVRAGIMSIIYLLGIAIFKNSDSLNSLGISVFIICLVNPNSACSIGLWLSCLSTLGIIVCFEPINDFLHKMFKKTFRRNKFIEYFISNISMSLSVEIFTLPIVIWCFKRISLVFIISNICIVCFLPALIISAFCANILNLLMAPKFLIYPFMFVASLVTRFIILVSEVLSKIFFATISLDYGVAKICVAFVLILVSIGIHSNNFKRTAKVIFLLSINLALCCIVSYQLLNQKVLNITVIPCGDGMCVRFSKNGRNAYIIGCNENSYFENLENSVLGSCHRDVDYLNIPILDESQKMNTTDLISMLNPSVLVCPNDNFGKLNLNNDNIDVICFNNYIDSFLWNEINIETLKKDKHIYVRVVSKQANVLIFPTGGDTYDLPESWKNCDFVIYHGLPINYRDINHKSAILSMNKRDAEINLMKFISDGERALSAACQGYIYLRITSKESYQIRRTQ